MVVPTLAAATLVLASVGLGAVVLATLGQWRNRAQLERSALAFAVGLGIIGWLFFWVGTGGGFRPVVAWAICGLSWLGLAVYRIPAAPTPQSPRLGAVEWMLVALAALAFAGDTFEALAPPVDADSLAYHFELSRRFVEAGRLFFVPRAFDGAAPLLVQMTYTAAFTMGGEKAMTLWTLLSGWGACALLISLCRRWLDTRWSLILALMFQTLPAMVYGAGSGQVEARLALFVLVAAIGLIEARRTDALLPAVLVGLGAGFYAGGKFTGLVFIAAAGLALLAVSGRRWFSRGLACGVAALVAGGQWYVWNFIHTGDPIFPVLFTVLGLPDGPYWDASYAAEMKAYLALRHDQIALWERWAYPVVATLFPSAPMEAGRVGLGPFFLMIMPVSLLGAWRFRRDLWRSPLAPVALMTVLFFLIWLQFGGIPKVRHLVPIIPVLTLCLGVAACRASESWAWRPLGMAAVLALAVNFAAVAFFDRPFVVHVLSGEDRESFLEQNISGYKAVAWLNTRTDVGRVLVMNRHFAYYIRRPNYLAFPGFQKQVEARMGLVTTDQFRLQIQQLGISHILTDWPTSASNGPRSIEAAIRALAEQGCLSLVKTFEDERRASRTLPSWQRGKQIYEVWRFDGEGCRKDPVN